MPDAGPWWDTGRPDEHGFPHYYRTTELSVLLILEVWLDGEPVTFRDAVQTFLWIDQLHDPQRREEFLTYFIRKSVGMLAHDPERLLKLRRKLLVVEPKDQHDFPRCKRSLETALMSVRCDQGVIHRHPPLPRMWELDAGIVPAFPERLGACPCRCHDMQRQAQGAPLRMLGAHEYFRESQLTEQEALRDV